ncbi:MAG: SDR family oxidoreductase [Geminicoccaceae bacterium]
MQGRAAILHTSVTGFTQKPNGEWLVMTGKGSVIADHIVITAGYCLNEIGALMGIDCPVIAMEHMYFITENISSQASVAAIDGHAAYSASKAGLNALTRDMTCEWAKHNIQVNAVCPTIIMTPLGRFGEPIEFADMALYLALPASDLVNGNTMLIDAGFSVI